MVQKHIIKYIKMKSEKQLWKPSKKSRCFVINVQKPTYIKIIGMKNEWKKLQILLILRRISNIIINPIYLNNPTNDIKCMSQFKFIVSTIQQGLGEYFKEYEVYLNVCIYTYAPEKRDWYKTLKSTYFNATNYNSYSFKFTAPYLLFTYQTIGLSMTLPIVDENVKFVGGVSSTFLGSKLVQYLSNNETGFQLIYLVSEDGTLIMHPFTVKADQLPLYIYNETYTGFNLTDWDEIKKTDGISSCQQFNLRTTLKCRYNSVTQQEMIVSIENLTEYKMYLIMLLSSSEYVAFTNSFHKTLEQELIDETIVQIISLVILFLVLCLLMIVATQILFQPIEIIVKTTQLWLHKKQQHVQITIPKFTQVFISNEIQMLEKACQFMYRTLEMHSFHKTEQCEAIENIKYPINQIEITPYLEYYRQLDYFNGQSQNKIKNNIRDRAKISNIFTYILKIQRNMRPQI